MSQQVGRVIDIVGTALMLSLILRFSDNFVNVVNAGGSQITSFYKAVAVQ